MKKVIQKRLSIFLIAGIMLSVLGGIGHSATPDWTPITGNQYNMVAYGTESVNEAQINASGY